MQFGKIPGHSALKDKLVKNIKSERIAHAQLFLGDDGSAPLAMAISYAQYLLCESRTEQDSCGECPSCKKITALSHPDLHFSFPIRKVKEKPNSESYYTEWREMLGETPFVDLATWYDKSEVGNSQPLIAVTEADSITKKLSLKSFEGGYKVLIMWHCEAMNQQTANKLLKLIEEPNPKTLIILVSDNYEQLLTTITSRTQLVKVNRLSDETVKNYLLGAANEETANSISSLTEGNLVKASLYLKNPEATEFYFTQFVSWMRYCYQRNFFEAFDWCDSLAKTSRVEQKGFLSFCLHMFRQSIVGNYTEMKMVKLNAKERAFMNKFSPFINNRNIVQLSTLISEAHYHIERNANAKIVFTDVTIKIIRLIRA